MRFGVNRPVLDRRVANLSDMTGAADVQQRQTLIGIDRFSQWDHWMRIAGAALRAIAGAGGGGRGRMLHGHVGVVFGTGIENDHVVAAACLGWGGAEAEGCEEKQRAEPRSLAQQDKAR